MINQNSTFPVTLWAVILLACGAMNISAQIKTKPGDWVKQIPTPPATEMNRNAADVTSVKGVIRWNKKYGEPPTGPATQESSPLPCGLMVVVAMKNIDVPDSFGRRQEQVATSFDQTKMTKFLKAETEGNYYVCPYELVGLPRDTSLTIVARFINPEYETVPWIGSWIEAPQPTHTRIFSGSQTLTLTNARPSAVVDFKIGYAPVPPMPR